MNRRGFLQTVIAAPFVIVTPGLLMQGKATKIFTAHDLLLEAVDRIINPPILIEPAFGGLMAAHAYAAEQLMVFGRSAVVVTINESSRDGLKFSPLAGPDLDAVFRVLEPGAIYYGADSQYLRKTIKVVDKK